MPVIKVNITTNPRRVPGALCLLLSPCTDGSILTDMIKVAILNVSYSFRRMSI
jgi:hypothetical protein